MFYSPDQEFVSADLCFGGGRNYSAHGLPPFCVTDCFVFTPYRGTVALAGLLGGWCRRFVLLFGGYRVPGFHTVGIETFEFVAFHEPFEV